ncbi:MAG TPA: ribulose bisphosphate carboxylase small subunit [Actinomycetota bacterium]
MKLMHGTFSSLPPLTDAEIRAQIAYAIGNGWPVAIEHTDDPHPRNVYWEMWDRPMFDEHEPDACLAEVNRCRAAMPDRYVRVTAFDASYGRQTTALSFLVGRPAHEPGFRLDRAEAPGRRLAYSVHSFAADAPGGERYATEPAPPGRARRKEH